MMMLAFYVNFVVPSLSLCACKTSKLYDDDDALVFQTLKPEAEA